MRSMRGCGRSRWCCRRTFVLTVRRALCRVLPVGLFWLRRQTAGRVALDDVVVSMVLMAASGNTRALELISHLDGTPQRLDHPPPRAYFVMPTAPLITPEQPASPSWARPAQAHGSGPPLDCGIVDHGDQA